MPNIPSADEIRQIIREELAALHSAAAPAPSTLDAVPAWLPTREAAAYARRKPATLRRWARERKVISRDHGGGSGLIFKRDSLDAYLGGSDASES